MVDVAQLVRAPVCGTGGRGFKSRHPPHIRSLELLRFRGFLFKTPGHTPIVKGLGVASGGTRYDRAGNSLKSALCADKNSATARFVAHQFPAICAPNNNDNTIETTRVHQV